MKKVIVFLFCILFFYSGIVTAQIYGCTDPLATNYNIMANVNDGTCLYNPTSITPLTSVGLDSTLSETSGLIYWNDILLTHNDNYDTELYALDTLTGTIVNSYNLSAVFNNDWEEIASDSDFIYVGDFGNNSNGNRTDLHILRIEKNSLLINSPVIDTIYFTYSDQTDFTPTGGNNTDFDCEAFIVSRDSIFLFTKQWVSNRTSLYSLPKLPGTYVANLQSTLNVQGLITGGAYLESKRMIVLSAYSNLLQPYIFLLYDFNAANFFSGNKRNISLALPFHQVEGITTSNGLKFYCSNEAFVQAPFINTPQKLHTFDLSPYLSNYLDELILNISHTELSENYIYPIPTTGEIYFANLDAVIGAKYSFYDQIGKCVFSGIVHPDQTLINITGQSSGFYFLKITDVNSVVRTYKIVKQ